MKLEMVTTYTLYALFRAQLRAAAMMELVSLMLRLLLEPFNCDCLVTADRRETHRTAHTEPGLLAGPACRHQGSDSRRFRLLWAIVVERIDSRELSDPYSQSAKAVVGKEPAQVYVVINSMVNFTSSAYPGRVERRFLRRLLSLRRPHALVVSPGAPEAGIDRLADRDRELDCVPESARCSPS